jgi:hypothetical protein
MKWALFLGLAAIVSSSCRKIDLEAESYGYGTDPELTTGIDSI